MQGILERVPKKIKREYKRYLKNKKFHVMITNISFLKFDVYGIDDYYNVSMRNMFRVLMILDKYIKYDEIFILLGIALQLPIKRTPIQFIIAISQEYKNLLIDPINKIFENLPMKFENAIDYFFEKVYPQSNISIIPPPYIEKYNKYEFESVYIKDHILAIKFWILYKENLVTINSYKAFNDE